jgi:hypothetical protein
MTARVYGQHTLRVTQVQGHEVAHTPWTSVLLSDQFPLDLVHSHAPQARPLMSARPRTLGSHKGPGVKHRTRYTRRQKPEFLAWCFPGGFGKKAAGLAKRATGLSGREIAGMQRLDRKATEGGTLEHLVTHQSSHDHTTGHETRAYVETFIT